VVHVAEGFPQRVAPSIVVKHAHAPPPQAMPNEAQVFAPAAQVPRRVMQVPEKQP